MGYLKSRLKKIMPDRVVYLYRIIQRTPAYFNAVFRKEENDRLVLKFYSDEETVNLITNERKSLCRFGDGELLWMVGQHNASFQKGSEKLKEDLRQSFFSTNTDLLIGLPIGFFDSSKCNLSAKMHWRTLRNTFFSCLKRLKVPSRVYCNASITRPYIDYCDRAYSKRCFENLKRIWNDKDVIFVEGSKTKLGMGNDLFDNCRSIRRIICPSENAFEQIDRIQAEIIKNADKNDLILGALGPTATILAARLCDLGYQFVDIGHVDIEYIWYLNKEIIRKPILGKYVNECGAKADTDYYDQDQEYLGSIVSFIG